MSAPSLETARLRLRAHRADDHAACAAMWADPLVVRYIGGTPSTPHQVWRGILGYAGMWALLGFGYWAVEEKATGRYVGEIGFADFKREIEPPLECTPEVGWALVPEAHGQGYATEALLAVIAWSDANLVSKRTVCLIHPENAPSIRLAGKFGYREVLRTMLNDRPVMLFSRG